jgi:DNA-directed RNA polymerase III subunit RPC1
VFKASFEEAKKNNNEIEKHSRKAMEDLNPLRVLNLFKMISPSDCELLNINPAEGRPEMFIWQYVPTPPVCIRPSVAQDSASTEDDLTIKLADIVNVSSLLRNAINKGQPLNTIMDQWDYLQLQIAMYVNSDVPGLQQNNFGKPIRGFCQRLKGKQGRFRGNLSGKRVDFSGRTVISPDPNLGIDEVAIPILVAKNLTYPERVQRHNIKKLQDCVRNGANIHPGAQQIIKKDSDHKISLKFARRENEAKNLRIGDIVERHLEDGDIVLFNRQPSLHKLSIMSHYVKVRPWRTFRLNECVCNPYNADFDGDEMNLHVPQTEEARTEAINLMGVKNNLSTPKNGEPIISATQDFITAAYLLSSKENFFDRKTFTNICMYMVDGNLHLDLPPPAILKPQALWTGKQVFSVLMRPNKASPVKVNLDAKCRDYTADDKNWAPDMDINDGWLVVRNSEVMCGRMDKTTVGSGKKDSIFYIILRDFGPDEAVTAMNRLAKVSARYLTNQGFSIGISDVYPSVTLTAKKQKLVNDAYGEANECIKQYNEGTLERLAGCDMDDSLENTISGKLSKVREEAGKYCIKNLSKWNSPLIMAKSGSKGSNINVAQMVAVVGQQIIGGKRVAEGFQDRTLPHFLKNARHALAKGFVFNSFFTGLTPTEFLFHAISGREGLVDTAVKTAETGYMSRRLMKSLEDLSTQYDDTVRNSSGAIVQFQFGADKLDPVDMEGSAVPVNFARTFSHAENLTWNNDDPCLLPYQLTAYCDDLLSSQKKKYLRKGLLGESLDYRDQRDYAIDEFDGARDFVETIVKHVRSLATKMADARQKSGLPRLEQDPNLMSQAYNESREDTQARLRVERVAKVSKVTLKEFISLCLSKYAKAHVEPGHAVGAVGAQSIGEPGTQMTLKTFHFAGVAGMSITQGVPRIKEIINASKVISTPVITCPLENEKAEKAARTVKGCVERTFLGDILSCIEDQWSSKGAQMCLQFDVDRLDKKFLGLSMADIASKIYLNKKLKILPEDVYIRPGCVFIRITETTGGNLGARGTAAAAKAKLREDGNNASELALRMSHLKRVLPEIAISGYPEATRAVIKVSKEEPYTYEVLVEGYGLRACMNTQGVIGTKVRSNSVMEMKDVLGIEAARSTIAKEIGDVMGQMDIDPRHMQLLADVMTYKGEVLGITRFGLSKMRDSVLQLASFEKTPDHLFDAAAGMKSDKIEGVSECIIMGQTMSLGTGAFQVVRRLGLKESDTESKPIAFEDAWRLDQLERRKSRKVRS